jgi:glycosyltransferase involved in cell wall biosynthesis
MQSRPTDRALDPPGVGPGQPTVLLLHNRYREPGGEERSVSLTADLLRARGHRVDVLERASEGLSSPIGRLRAGAALVRGGAAPGEVGRKLQSSRAEVVHAHNLLPLLGARSLAAAKDAGARVVMHLHNYRLVCAIATAFRDGHVCVRCHGRNTWPGVRLRCRRNLPEAAAYGAGLALHQRELLHSVDEFVVPSAAAAARLHDLGLPKDRMRVLHNFLPASAFSAESEAHRGDYALFAGRLVEEKGADVAIEAARRAGVPLLVAGDGPDRGRLERLAWSAGPGGRGGTAIRFGGRLSASAMEHARRRAAFVVAPSRWDEPCPYAVIEAMAAGAPVLASRAGGLPEMVGPDVVLPPRDVEAWAGRMRTLWDNGDLRRQRGDETLRRARDLFGEDRFYDGLMAAYAADGER